MKTIYYSPIYLHVVCMFPCVYCGIYALIVYAVAMLYSGLGLTA